MSPCTTILEESIAVIEENATGSLIARSEIISDTKENASGYRRYDFGNPTENQTSRLRPHPLNEGIYGDSEPDAALLKSVAEHGIFNPIIINKNKEILSGTRRWLAAKAAGYTKVPVITLLSSGANELLGELFLIESNRARVKTQTVMDAEAAHLLRIEKELAAKRQTAGVRQNLAEGGKAVEKVAEQTGESAETVRKRVEIHEARVDPQVRNAQSTNKAFENLPKPTACDICQQSFPSKGAMKAHRNEEHAAEMDARRHLPQPSNEPLMDIENYLPEFNMTGFPYTGKPEFDLTGKIIRGDILVHHWFASAPRDSSIVWLVENLKENEADLWRTCDLRLYEREGDKKNKRTHGIFGVWMRKLLVNGKTEFVSSHEIFAMWLEKAKERLAQIKALPQSGLPHHSPSGRVELRIARHKEVIGLHPELADASPKELDAAVKEMYRERCSAAAKFTPQSKPRTARYQAFIDEFPLVSTLGFNGRVTAEFRAEHPNTKDYASHILDVWMSNKKWKYQGGLPTGGAQAPPENAGSIPSSPLQDLPTWNSSESIQKAVPDTNAEYPDLQVGERIVIQKGKSLFRLDVITGFTPAYIVGEGCRFPKTTYRVWNTILLRKATEDDLKTFDYNEWRDAKGRLIVRDSKQFLSETFYVIRRKSDRTYLQGGSFTDEVGPATKYEGAEDSKLQPECEWVRVEAVYELAVVPSTASLAAPTASVEAA